MKIKVKKLVPGAVMPERAHVGDAGFDLVAVSRPCSGRPLPPHAPIPSARGHPQPCPASATPAPLLRRTGTTSQQITTFSYISIFHVAKIQNNPVIPPY